MSSTRSTLDAIEAMAFALVSLTSRALTEGGGQHLTFQQWRAIVVLGAAAAPLRISELSKRIGASGPSTSRIAQRLVKLQLVIGEPDSADRRAVRIRLTERGALVRGQVVSRRRDLIRELIGERADQPISREGKALVEALAAAT